MAPPDAERGPGKGPAPTTSDSDPHRTAPPATASPLFTWREMVLHPRFDSGLSPTERLVAIALSMHMDTATLMAHPGPAILARRTGLSQSAVKAALKTLRTAGWIRQVKKGGTRAGGRLEASVYQGTRPGGDPVQVVNGAPRTEGGREPVQVVTGTRAGAGHQLVPELDRELAPAPELVRDAKGYEFVVASA